MTDQTPLSLLEPLLADTEIKAIHIREDIRYEKAGKTHISEIRFESDAQRRQLIDGILLMGNVILSASNPVVDCTLSDGTQVHAEHAPLLMSLRKQ